MSSLSRLSWTVVAGGSPWALIVPIGATEQHGPHLPLTTDSDIAAALADRLHAVQPHDVVIAPVIAFGSSGEHQSFPGTVSVGQAALENYLIELGRSATRTWDQILLLSTHGGNRETVRRATDRLRAEGRDVCAWFPSWSGDHHAGRTETSLMLAIAPDRANMDVAEAGVADSLERLMPRLVRSGVAAVSPNGVLGDPSGASAGEGERLLAAAGESLSELIASWPSGDAVGATA